jgi:hypothetical protein
VFSLACGHSEQLRNALSVYPVALLMGKHWRLGAGTAIQTAFFGNDLFDAKLLRQAASLHGGLALISCLVSLCLLAQLRAPVCGRRAV